MKTEEVFDSFKAPSNANANANANTSHLLTQQGHIMAR